MNIVQAKPEDASIILSFYYALIEKMRDHPYRPRWIRDVYPTHKDITAYCREGEMWVAEHDGTIAAAMVIARERKGTDDTVQWTVDAQAEQISVIRLLAVEPDLQNKGIATSLLNLAKRICADRGDKAIRLEALSDSVPGNRLYKKNGYQLVCVRTYRFDIAGDIEFCLYELPLCPRADREGADVL